MFWCFGNLILNFSKILNQKATHEPSGQHILNEEYYDRIEAIQFTMNHDDGNLINEVQQIRYYSCRCKQNKQNTNIYLFSQQRF